MLFSQPLSSWDDWSAVFRRADLFTPLVRAILASCGRPAQDPVCLTPGTNAVFAVGDAVIKLFVPAETGYDAEPDFEAERAGLARAAALGVPAPRILAQGVYEDLYRWRWLLLSRVPGREYGAVPRSEAERRAIGRRLRRLTDRLNTPQPPDPGFAEGRRDESRWREKGFSEGFLADRRAFLDAHPPEDWVWCHADITGENLMAAPDGSLALIDFADAAVLPRVCEEAVIIGELFRFDPAGLSGFLGEGFDGAAAAERCLTGLLQHPFGAYIVSDRFPDALPGSVEALRGLLRAALG